VKVRKIDHLGLACRSSEAAATFYAQVLGLPVVARETLEDRKLKVVKLRSGESTLELLEPLPGEAVISKFLATRGEGIHHVCFEVEDIRAAARELASQGYRPLHEEPEVGAGGHWVNFLRPRETFGVLIELSQVRRAGP
jgi:methylmalonyl-CoA/ethylmalonyl-CoA epimerase